MNETRSKHTLSMLLIGLMAGVGIMLILPKSDGGEPPADGAVVETTALGTAEAPVAETTAAPDTAPAAEADAPTASPEDLPAGAEFTTSEELEAVLAPSIVRVLVHEQAVLYVNDSAEVSANAP
jgi:hypothetical protein